MTLITTDKFYLGGRMKLNFQIECEEHERREIQHYLQATEMLLALSDIAEILRKELKYNETPISLEEFRDQFWTIINDRNLEKLL